MKIAVGDYVKYKTNLASSLPPKVGKVTKIEKTHFAGKIWIHYVVTSGDKFPITLTKAQIIGASDNEKDRYESIWEEEQEIFDDF